MRCGLTELWLTYCVTHPLHVCGTMMGRMLHMCAGCPANLKESIPCEPLTTYCFSVPHCFISLGICLCAHFILCAYLWLVLILRCSESLCLKILCNGMCYIMSLPKLLEAWVVYIFKIFFSSTILCVMCVYECGSHVEVRGQFSGVRFPCSCEGEPGLQPPSSEQGFQFLRSSPACVSVLCSNGYELIRS